MVYGTKKSVSYDVQPTSVKERAKMHWGGTKMSEGHKICNITGELLSNGCAAMLVRHCLQLVR